MEKAIIAIALMTAIINLSTATISIIRAIRNRKSD
jgi:hypothetical protein